MTQASTTTTEQQTGTVGHMTRVGKVVSDSRDKTIKVLYSYSVKHRMYGKYVSRSTTLHAHDANNEAKNGDVVELTACRPLSKTKFWRLTRVIRTAAR